MARRLTPISPQEVEHLQHDLDEENPKNDTVDNNTNTATTNGNTTLSIDELYDSERSMSKVNHWRNNYYAAGLVEPTWKDELRRHTRNDEDGDVNGPNRSCCADAGSPEMEPTCGCLILSAHVCSKLGASRVGNMAILREKNVISSGGGSSTRNISLVVGPYWPILLFVTYPIILTVSIAAATKVVFVQGQSNSLRIIWTILTFGLCYSLFSIGFRDPGILPRYRECPNSDGDDLNMTTTINRGRRGNGKAWRWNDQAQTYMPPGAYYDPDCAVVVEQFDHTCPWTGTAIGKKNMPAFQCFLFLVFTCLIMDVLLLTGAFDP